MKNMDVLILTGGQGSRLRTVVNDRPKTMAQINGRPFLDMLIEHLSGFGFTRYTLCVSYMAEFIKEYYRTNNTNSLEITFSSEVTPLGTGGAVKHAASLIASDTFLVLNGDSFCPVDFHKFIEFHLEKSALLSMVLSPAEGSDDYGSVVIDGSNRVMQFREKKPIDKTWINAGVYLFEKKVLSLIPSGDIYSLEYDLFPQLIGKDFFGFPTAGKVIDIGTPERYMDAMRTLPL